MPASSQNGSRVTALLSKSTPIVAPNSSLPYLKSYLHHSASTKQKRRLTDHNQTASESDDQLSVALLTGSHYCQRFNKPTGRRLFKPPASRRTASPSAARCGYQSTSGPLPEPPRNIRTFAHNLVEDLEWSYGVAREVSGLQHRRSENRYNESVVEKLSAHGACPRSSAWTSFRRPLETRTPIFWTL